MPLTAVKLAIGDGGASDQTEAFNETWKSFQGPANARAWDGRALYYYQQGVDFEGCASSSFVLLTNPTGSGQCGSWAFLLMNALAVNGIESDFVRIRPTQGAWMLVKQWRFKGPPTYPNNEPWSYKVHLGVESKGAVGMVTTPPIGPVFGDLVSTAGLSGQNTGTPSEKAFNFHFIVKVQQVPDIGGPYFDPSYGATYEDPCDFEDQAIAGYGERNYGLPGNFLYVRKAFGGCSVSMEP